MNKLKRCSISPIKTDIALALFYIRWLAMKPTKKRIEIWSNSTVNNDHKLRRVAFVPSDFCYSSNDGTWLIAIRNNGLVLMQFVHPQKPATHTAARSFGRLLNYSHIWLVCIQWCMKYSFRVHFVYRHRRNLLNWALCR